MSGAGRGTGGAESDPATVARINSALARLSEREREVFLAVSVDDLSYAEIAERLGLSAEQVMRLFGSALANMDRNLHEPRRCWWRRWWQHWWRCLLR